MNTTFVSKFWVTKMLQICIFNRLTKMLPDEIMFKIYSASSSSTSEVTLTQVLDSAHYLVQVAVAALEAAVAPAQVEAVVVVLLLVLKRPAVYRQAFVPIADAEVKVSKFQQQIFLFSFEPKNKQTYFLISALSSKMG